MTLQPKPIVLQMEAQGVLRLGGTGVALADVIRDVDAGATCEQLLDRYFGLSPRLLHGLLSFYRGDPDAVHQYLRDAPERGAVSREAGPGVAGQPKTNGQRDTRSLSEVFAELRAEMPPEEWEKMPRDGSERVDFYLYGAREDA